MAGSQLVSRSVCGLTVKPDKVFVVTEMQLEHKQNTNEAT